MKKNSMVVALFLIVAMSVGLIAPASAGQLAIKGVSVEWDDASLYQPNGCSLYYFNFTSDDGVLFADLVLTNKFGDKLGSGSISGSSGRSSMQVCSTFADFTPPLTLTLDVQRRSVNSDGSKGSISSNITLLSRTSSQSNQKNSSSQSNVDLLTQISKMNQTIKSLNTRINKICSVRPKPKFC